MNARLTTLLVLAACGSTSAPPPMPRATSIARTDESEAQRKQELAAAHNKLLDEQATALAATCARPAEAPARCLPTCYVAEPPDARAGKLVPGVAEIVHLVCASSEEGPFAITDEVAGTLDVRTYRGRIPKAAKKGSWQAAVETAVAASLEPDLARGDAVRVTGGWKSLVHPASKERLRCVTVSHYAKAHRKLDACGSHGAIACEATGNAAAHGLNVVHYRLAEARRYLAARDEAKCQQAALEAVAVARGLPRWRQYVKLNTDQWKASPRYRTRFDGVLDEDTLFQTAIDLGTAAQEVYVSCGGAPNPTTSAADEQSFHTCP
ncbi:MAG: hypothetical protein HOV81_26450 [Kofleriaceae bacterium]|nr:hypothetical protein [Kofleriaceae bacterium]